MPVILATQEAEIGSIVVQSQPRQIVQETLSRKTLHKNGAGGVAQGEGPEFKPKYWKKNIYIYIYIKKERKRRHLGTLALVNNHSKLKMRC
jgi:hypothetical protein